MRANRVLHFTPMQRRRSGSVVEGFSLVELAMVLVIIGLLAGGSIAMLLAELNRQGYARTEAKLNTIQTTILNFAKANGYIACPSDITLAPSASAYGTGTGTGTVSANCTAGNLITDGSNSNVVLGSFPNKTYHLDDSYALDGFGRPFLYAAYVPLTAVGGGTAFPIGTSITGITIKDDAGGTRTGAAIYALVSLGAEGHGAWPAVGGTARRNIGATNSAVLQDCHCHSDATASNFDSTFVEKKETGDESKGSSDSNQFDDIVRFSELFDLNNTGITASR